MKYDEFKRQLGKAGLSIKAFTMLVKVSASTITNYKKNGEVPSHWAIIALLMGEMADNGLDFKAALSKIDIEPNKVRGAAAKGRFGGSKQTDLLI
jgi:hypothetical protein